MCDMCNGATAEDIRRDLLKHVAEHDYATIAVAADHDQLTGLRVPGCHYTLGLWALRETPEVIVIGAPDHHGRDLVRQYAERTAAGERFAPGYRYDGFIDGYQVTFEQVAQQHYPDWLTSAGALYPDADFPTLQLLWPKHDHAWPWQTGCYRFRRAQPVLTASGAPESWLPGVNGP